MNPYEHTRIILETASALKRKGLDTQANDLFDQADSYAGAARVDLSDQKKDIQKSYLSSSKPVNQSNNIQSDKQVKFSSIDDVLRVQSTDNIASWALVNHLSKNINLANQLLENKSYSSNKKLDNFYLN